MNKENKMIEDCRDLLEWDSKRNSLTEAWNRGYEFAKLKDNEVKEEPHFLVEDDIIARNSLKMKDDMSKD